MPFFQWKGIDLSGEIKKGLLRALSVSDLEYHLLKNDIALLQAYQKRSSSLFNPISTSLQVTFFRQLATLVDAGVYLDQALLILHEQTSHKSFNLVLQDCSSGVFQGLSLYTVLTNYRNVFDNITLQLIQAGEHGSNLGKALFLLADYHERREAVKKQLQSAAFLPCITLVFFLIICTVIFVAIVPMFTTMFSSLNQELPASTKRLQVISNFLSSKNFLWSIIVILLAFFIAKRWCKRMHVKSYIDCILLKIPFIKDLMFESTVTYFFHAAGLLMQGGVQVVQALEMGQRAINNVVLQKYFEIMQHDVNKGKSLSNAMVNVRLFKPEVIALIRVGEESGALDTMIIKSAEVYRERVKRKLQFITTVFQPLLMIVLGLLIMALILSVYVPIFDLSYAVH